MSLETPSPDPLNIGELVKEEKPLKAIDFCYHDEDEMVNVLDCISMCVMVIAYAPDSFRGQQMLVSNPACNVCCFIRRFHLMDNTLFFVTDNSGGDIAVLRSTNPVSHVQ